MSMLNLNGEWKLYYAKEEGPMPDSPRALVDEGWPCIVGTVPGNVELDLFAAGIEEEPFFGENLYSYTKYEYYQWWYVRDVYVDTQPEPGQEVILRFEGLDTYGSVFVNESLVGTTENMLIPHEFDITDTVKLGNNSIHVRIESAMNKARAYDYPVYLASLENNKFMEMCRLRKAPHSVGWDIMPRFLSAGLWRDVTIETRPATRIKETYFATLEANAREAKVCAAVSFSIAETDLLNYSVRFIGTCGDHEFRYESGIRFIAHKFHFTVPNPVLWWPRGLGEPNVYVLETQLRKNGQIVDSRTERVGIRTARIDAVYGRKEDFKFDILINGRKLLAMGTNWVPLDAFHSRDPERVEAALGMVNDLGCNIVRCWGGNVYEDHRFFDICDESGILVWQDFSFACAIYPQNEEFFSIVRAEAATVVKKLRNHPSILLWAGDNEIDMFYQFEGYNLPHTRHNEISRSVIPSAVRDHDPYRWYLPSSPYVPEESPPDILGVPEQHNWGPRDYFKGDFYKHSTAAFISETGYHGCPGIGSLKSFISPDKLWPNENSEWDTHDTDYLPAGGRTYNRIRLMSDQVETLFGEVPRDIERYILASQISQAEAKKYFIERVRSQRAKMGGIIWWNLLDGWPQISDAVVDYYFHRKLAYHYIKRAQQPVCCFMTELEEWHHGIVVDNPTAQAVNVTVSVRSARSGDVVHEGHVALEPQSQAVSGVYRSLPGKKELYILEWQTDDGQGANHYISGYPPFDLEEYAEWLRTISAITPAFDANACVEGVDIRSS